MPLPDAHTWLPWLPDANQAVADTPALLTTISDALSGAEDRASWYAAPRRRLSYRILAPSLPSTLRIEENLRAARVGGRVSLPHWRRGNQLTAYAIGSVAISTTRPHGFAPGDMAALYRPGDEQARLVEIATAPTATTATLTSVIPAGWSGVVWITRVMHGRLEEPSWSPLSLDLRSFTVDFSELPVPPAPAAAWGDLEYDASVFWIKPVSLVWQALAHVDDDVRLSIDGVPIANKRENVGWYNGATTVFPPGPTNSLFTVTGFRRIDIDAAAATALGGLWRYGATIQVDTYDGWGPNWRGAPWQATITFSDGSTAVKTGGSLAGGASVAPNSGFPIYFLTGPHFDTYYPNGSFALRF